MNDMVAHYRVVHLKFKQFQCKICGWQFGKDSGLKRHIFAKHLDPLDPLKEKGRNSITKDHPAFEDLQFVDGSGFPTKDEVVKMITKET